MPTVGDKIPLSQEGIYCKPGQMWYPEAARIFTGNRGCDVGRRAEVADP